MYYILYNCNKLYSRCCRSIVILLYNNIKRIDLNAFTTTTTTTIYGQHGGSVLHPFGAALFCPK